MSITDIGRQRSMWVWVGLEWPLVTALQEALAIAANSYFPPKMTRTAIDLLPPNLAYEQEASTTGSTPTTS
jgi:hypothetical protein